MRETAFQSHVAASDWSWTPLLCDYDCDGLLDIFITNGMVRDFTNADALRDRGFDEISFVGRTEWDLHEDGEPNPEQNMALRNLGGAQFSDVSRAWGLAENSVSFGACWADLDGDGDLDIVSTNLGKAPSVYRNDSSGNRAVILLEDPDSMNRRGDRCARHHRDRGWRAGPHHPPGQRLPQLEPTCRPPSLRARGGGAHQGGRRRVAGRRRPLPGTNRSPRQPEDHHHAQPGGTSKAAGASGGNQCSPRSVPRSGTSPTARTSPTTSYCRTSCPRSSQ